MFPAAAATEDLAVVGRRTVSAVRMTGLVLFPLVPVAIVLAPEVIPAVLGDKWAPMVTPFQFLLAVGIAHAVANTIGESLSGTGNIRFRARLDVPWAVLTLVAVAVLAEVDGIRGAAVGHLAAFVPLAAAYALLATRRIGTSPLGLWRGLRGVLLAVAVQAAVTVGVRALADGAGDAAAAAVAAAAGLLAAVAVLLVLPSAPLRDARRLLRAGRS
jgi:O-antigen/teichoic acid export membrane protein